MIYFRRRRHLCACFVLVVYVLLSLRLSPVSDFRGFNVMLTHLLTEEDYRDLLLKTHHEHQEKQKQRNILAKFLLSGTNKSSSSSSSSTTLPPPPLLLLPLLSLLVLPLLRSLLPLLSQPVQRTEGPLKEEKKRKKKSRFSSTLFLNRL